MKSIVQLDVISKADSGEFTTLLSNLEATNAKTLLKNWSKLIDENWLADRSKALWWVFLADRIKSEPEATYRRAPWSYGWCCSAEITSCADHKYRDSCFSACNDYAQTKSDRQSGGYKRALKKRDDTPSCHDVGFISLSSRLSGCLHGHVVVYEDQALWQM